MAVEITETPRHTLTVSEQNWQLKLSTTGVAALPDDATFNTVTVNSLLTANHIHGNIAGQLYIHVEAQENLTKGDPVYVSGYNSGTNEPKVRRAQANDNAKMPAIGVIDADYAADAAGANCIISGIIEDINTQGFGINNPIYVGPTGGFTATKPSTNPQQVGICDRDQQNNGSFVITAKEIAPNQDLNTNSTVSFSNVTVTSDLSAGGGALQVGSDSVLTSSDSLSVTGAARFLPQASAPSPAVTGQVYFDSTLSKLRCYDGTSWNNLF
jgi:hypothetical protein